MKQQYKRLLDEHPFLSDLLSYPHVPLPASTCPEYREPQDSLLHLTNPPIQESNSSPSHPRECFLSCYVSGCSYIPDRLALVTWSGHCLPISLQFIFSAISIQCNWWEELHLIPSRSNLHLSLSNIWTHLS